MKKEDNIINELLAICVLAVIMLVVIGMGL